MRRMGIVAKLAFTSAGILLALGIGVAFYSLFQLRTMLYGESFRRIEAQSLSWIDANQGPLAYANPEVLTRLLVEFTQRERLAYAVLEDPGGRTIAQCGIPTALRPETAQAVASVGTTTVHGMRADEGTYFEARTSVKPSGTGMSRDLSSMFAMAAGAQSGGVLRVGIDRQELEGRIRGFVWRSAPLYGALVLLAIFVQITMARLVVDPVVYIAKAARGVAGGNLSVRVDQGAELQNEVGELVRNFNDMTSRLEQNRMEMEAFQARLEEQVRARTAELELLNSQLRETDRRKSEFLSTVSHEVRTPLTSIKAFAEILLDSKIEDNQTRTRFLRVINDETERLARLISDLLDLAKIESGVQEWKFVEVDARQLVHDAIAAVAPTAQEKGLTTDVLAPERCRVRADVDRMRQVLTNLLSNAIKFSHEGGRIQVSIAEASRSERPHATIAVKDTGPGIDPADHSRIFERFYRAAATARRVKGTGLGLAISREIVLRHEGEIWVESAPGRGSTFCFTVPLAAEPDRAAVAADSTDQKGALL